MLVESNFSISQDLKRLTLKTHLNLGYIVDPLTAQSQVLLILLKRPLKTLRERKKGKQHFELLPKMFSPH